MVSNIPFGSYQPEWKDYLKTYSSIFGWKFRKVTLPLTFHPEFPKFSVKWLAPLGQFLLGMCHWPLRTPTPLESIRIPSQSLLGKCDFCDPNLLTFCLCIYNPRQKSFKTPMHFPIPQQCWDVIDYGQPSHENVVPFQQHIPIRLLSNLPTPQEHSNQLMDY